MTHFSSQISCQVVFQYHFLWFIRRNASSKWMKWLFMINYFSRIFTYTNCKLVHFNGTQFNFNLNAKKKYLFHSLQTIITIYIIVSFISGSAKCNRNIFLRFYLNALLRVQLTWFFFYLYFVSFRERRREKKKRFVNSLHYGVKQ